MGDYSKQKKRALRELVGQAYRAELEAELDKLFASFQRWKAGQLTPADLARAIHEFHEGPNRDLFKVYNSRDLRIIAARAVALRLIDTSSMPRCSLTSNRSSPLRVIGSIDFLLGNVIPRCRRRRSAPYGVSPNPSL